MMRRRPILRTVGRTAVIAGTASVVAGGVNRRQQARAQAGQEVAQPQEQYINPANEAPAPGSPEAINQLKELASLKDQGILTEEEFAAQKAKLLG
jgi:hypothetical protein